MTERTRILILGGTGEAAALAMRLGRIMTFEVVISLAGRTKLPAALPGEVRRGGFGGPEGLARYLTERHIALVIDATHPFAAVISRNAAEACRAAGVPRAALVRPPWRQQPEDRWTTVPDMDAAAALLPDLGTRVFLTSGRQGIEAFAPLEQIWFLVRLIEPPDGPLPLANHAVIYGRGPFTVDLELALLEQHEIGVLVSKNSGGAATHAKLEAARRRGLPVVMIERPPPPDGELVQSVDDAMAWIEAHGAGAE